VVECGDALAIILYTGRHDVRIPDPTLHQSLQRLTLESCFWIRPATAMGCLSEHWGRFVRWSEELRNYETEPR
jgi:hypothetical protein